MMAKEHVFDLMPEFVLGALDEHESRQFFYHLAGCPLCQRELDLYEQMMVSLATELPQTPPPDALRGRLLEKFHPSKHREPSPLQPFASARFVSLFRRRWPVWAALGLLVLLAISNILLWQQTSKLQAEILDTRMIVHPLYALDDNPYTGLVVMDPQGDFGTIIVDSLPPEQPYQIWLSREGQIVSGGGLVVHQNGYGAKIIYVPEPLHLYERVWITIEPNGEVEQPSGPTVLQTD